MQPDASAGDGLPAVCALLRALIAEVRALRAERSSGPAATLCRQDRAKLARLLPAAAGVLGSEMFLSSDVAESDAPALRLVCGNMNARQLGRLLKRAAGIPISGYLVERVGAEAGAVLWRILQVPEFPPVRNHSVPVDAAACAVSSGLEVRTT